MTFEKEFPSLKDCQFAHVDYEPPCELKVIQAIYPNTKEGEWLRIIDVQEHCLDKAKVREVLLKLQSEVASMMNPTSESTSVLQRLFERKMRGLGL